MPGIERKFFLDLPGADVKLDGDQRSRVTGLASTFNTTDLTGDTIEPGAFEASLNRWRSGRRQLAMLDHHKMDAPVGVWERIEETERGLEVQGRLTMGVQRAKELQALLIDGAVTAMSIGFRSIRDRLDPSGVRVLEEIDLLEISLVTLPANPLAVVEAIKSTPQIKTARDFERALREHLGFSARAAKGITARGFDEGEVRDAHADHAGEVRDVPGVDLSGLREALAKIKTAL